MIECMARQRIHATQAARAAAYRKRKRDAAIRDFTEVLTSIRACASETSRDDLLARLDSLIAWCGSQKPKDCSG